MSLPRRLLGPAELVELDDALLDAYRQHFALCERRPIARGRISRPSIPAAF